MFILRVIAKDQPGIVAAVANTLSAARCNIEESAQFHDPHSGQFFMRVVFAPLEAGAQDAFAANFGVIAADFGIQYDVVAQGEAVKAVILVSKDDHCLHDLLYRWRTGALNIDIVAVASNHDNNRALVEAAGLAFYHYPVTSDTKADQETQLRGLIENTGADLIVMARYMQILSVEFCRDYAGRVINIHHSFLPGFKGARPYHQAYERGVKIIGATAHFATVDLDEGPIIVQDVLPIDHSYTPQKLQTVGRDGEARALARAIDLYVQHRIFLHGNRTVIL